MEYKEERENIEDFKKYILIEDVPLFETYEFGSQRCENTMFDNNFSRHDPESMLLFINMHGGIIITDSLNTDLGGNEPIVKTCRDSTLNKFSSAGVGQCTMITRNSSKYIAYSLCEAAINDDISLDIDIILRESMAHRNAIKSKNARTPLQIYKETPHSTILARTYGLKAQSECTSRNFDEVKYTEEELLGNVTTFGNKYLEKLYDVKSSSYITICKKWDAIEANIMDNLLENEFFKDFIVNKRDTTKSKSTKSIHNNKVYVISPILLSDIIEFCELYGMTSISILDNSCSVFNGSQLYTEEEIALINENIKKLPPDIAKGANKTKRMPKKLTKIKQKAKKLTKIKQKAKKLTKIK
jgi:hypothetical protein